MIDELHFLISAFLYELLWNGIMSVLLLILAEILKCLNDQAFACMPYGYSAAFCIFSSSCKLGL